DAYESDLPFLKYAQSVRISTEAYPGEFFEGRIAFIHPVLNEATRTVRVRVNIPNGEGRLKPGMLIRAMITPEIGDRGVVLAPDLAGKWICPMHPEIIRDEPGNCDVCGMPLVRAEELGLVTNQKDITPPLVIPASAALLTGKRAVVYVEKAGDDGTYEGREAALGPRVGDHYVVLEGLTEGDRVVTRGNFRIDSELQIRARPSMMSRQTGDDEDGAADHSEHTNSTDETAIRRFEDIPGEFTAGLSKVYAAYYRIQQALASDDIERAKEAAGELTASLDKVPASLLSSDAKNTWSRDSVRAARLAGELAASATMEDARARFRSITDVILQTAHGFGNPGEKPMIRFFCPMAFNNQGAQWLQDHSGVENPYFGAMMYRCGEELEAVGGDK
ncbi:MAG TPA: efflux RND transporter periplasmic adaptor subunit, partial [Candidatus Sumerlaeota bacterium]|nr:efflux RND transporter periplasmic adaptor subunit [Candidatus Sumerlaeota bacterium]